MIGDSLGTDSHFTVRLGRQYGFRSLILESEEDFQFSWQNLVEKVNAFERRIGRSGDREMG